MRSLLFPLLAFARAGGAGGGHSSGGGSYGGGSSYSGSGGGGDVGFIFDLIAFLLRSGPIGWLILAVLAYLAYWVLTHAQNEHGQEIVFRSDSALSKQIDQKFTSAFPGESYPAFQEKVTKAFLTIQESWSNQTVAPMRRFITDGVYQRFHAQFTMMKLLEQQNPVTGVRVLGVNLTKVGRDGAYDFADVMIQARASDQFVCRKFPELNSPGGEETFTEFWTFLRRTDHRPGKDLYGTESCPQCGAPLTDKLMETARCPYCNTYLNSGEFDWVLAEITQSADYGVPVFPGVEVKGSDHGVASLRSLDPGFSEHQLEDKATNAFMEILIGTALGQAALVRRFATEPAYAAMQAAWPKGKIAYDRLYTRAVELLDTRIEGTEARAWVGIRYAFHRVDLEHPVAPVLDEPPSELKVLALVRDYSGGAPKGSVYAGSCPHCGAPQKDNLSPLCDHCGQPLNDQRLDWMIEGVMDPAAYAQRGKT